MTHLDEQQHYGTCERRIEPNAGLAGDLRKSSAGGNFSVTTSSKGISQAELNLKNQLVRESRAY